jgi:hypothetical protein
MFDSGSTQVLQQTTYFSHDIDSTEFNCPTQHTDVMLVLMEAIVVQLSGGVNLWMESRQVWTLSVPVLR